MKILTALAPKIAAPGFLSAGGLSSKELLEQADFTDVAGKGTITTLSAGQAQAYGDWFHKDVCDIMETVCAGVAADNSLIKQITDLEASLINTTGKPCEVILTLTPCGELLSTHGNRSGFGVPAVQQVRPLIAFSFTFIMPLGIWSPARLAGTTVSLTDGALLPNRASPGVSWQTPIRLKIPGTDTYVTPSLGNTSPIPALLLPDGHDLSQEPDELTYAPSVSENFYFFRYSTGKLGIPVSHAPTILKFTELPRELQPISFRNHLVGLVPIPGKESPWFVAWKKARSNAEATLPQRPPEPEVVSKIISDTTTYRLLAMLKLYLKLYNDLLNFDLANTL